MDNIEFYLLNGTVKAVQDDSGEWKLLVLGAPYYGHRSGKDAYGEYFSQNTDFMLDLGDKRPVVYYHGLSPEGDMDKIPEIIGMATAVKRDNEGLWFEVVLNKAKDLAKRVWDASLKGIAKASSGAVAHLVRKNEDGEIVIWPIGELSLFDTSKNRQPANQLAVAIPLKAHFDELNLTLPQTFAEGMEPRANVAAGDKDNPELNLNNKLEGEETMDTNEVVNEVLAALKAEQAAEKAEAERLEAIKKEAYEAAKAEFEAKVPAWKGGFNTKKVTELGLANDSTKAFLYWVKTGDEGAIRAAAPMVAGTPANGGYAVPDDFYGNIVAKRDEASIVRRMGAQIIQTSRDVINVPVEDGELGAFSITSENTDVTTAGENEPTLAQKAITVYTFRNLVKVSQELMEDDGSNLEVFLMNSFARKLAEAENKYALVGAGSTEPQGVMVGGTKGLDFDDDTTIAAAEIPELYYKLAQQYRDGACWVMNGATEGYLRGLSGNQFQFGILPNAAGGIGWETLLNKPVFNNSNIATIAAEAKTIMFGNFQYYGFVERKGLTVMRLNERFADTGMIGLLAVARFGGAVLQAEAFQYGKQAASG